MANPDRLHITYHPARRSVSFTVYEGDTVVKNTYESLTKYSINKKHEFVLNLCGDDFLGDILHPFVGKDVVDISMTTTRLDYEDFLRQVEEYNSRHHTKIRLLELDPNNELPDMTTSFDNIKEQGEKIVSLLDEHWLYIRNIECESTNTKTYLHKVSEKLTVEKENIKNSLKSLTEDNNVNLCLVGVHSSGKSTLINTLFGYEILPVDIRPETAKVLKIKGVPGVESIYVEFSRTENQVQKTCKIGWDSSNNFLIIKDINMSLDYTSTLRDELLKNRMKRYDEQVRALLDYLNPDESVDAKVDLGFPIPFESTDLKFTLYDTPGTDSNIAYHQQILSEALNQTNSILLFVLIPDSVAGSGNVTLMNLLLEKSANSNNSIDMEQSFFIFNKIDSVKPNDIQKLKIGQLKKSEADINPIPLAERKVFFLSASSGFAAIAKKNGVSNADCEHTLKYDCEKSLDLQYGCYYQHNHFGKSKYITDLNLKKTNNALETETNELDKYIISSGIYSLVEAIKDYGLRYASTVKTSAIIKSIESAATSVSTMVKETSLGTDEKVQDIYQQLDSEIKKVHEIIKKTSAKYEAKSLSSNEERKEILKKLEVSSDNFDKLTEETNKSIDERLGKRLLFNLNIFDGNINSQTETLMRSDIEYIYKQYVDNYKEKRTAYLIEQQRNFIDDFMDMVEKSELSEETKEKLKIFKLPSIPEFEVEKKLKELFGTAKVNEWGFLKKIVKKIAQGTSKASELVDQKIKQENQKEDTSSLQKENLDNTEKPKKTEIIEAIQEKVEWGIENILEGSKEAINKSLQYISKGMEKLNEKVDTLETRTLNKENFLKGVTDWMHEKQGVVTEKFWEDLSSALNQMCEDLSKEFTDNIELYSTKIKALKEEHEPLVILSENIRQLQNSISDVQSLLNGNTKGVNS